MTSVASEHSLKGVSGGGLQSVDLVNVALESFAVLERHQRVGARFFVDGFGVSLDRAARRSTQLTVGLVFVVAVELLGVPLVDVIRVTAVGDRATQLQRWQTPSFACGFDGLVDGNLRTISPLVTGVESSWSNLQEEGGALEPQPHPASEDR